MKFIGQDPSLHIYIINIHFDIYNTLVIILLFSIAPCCFLLYYNDVS